MKITTAKQLENILDGLIEAGAELKPRVVYERLHDDHDGDFDGRLKVQMGPDGDMWIMIDDSQPIRFRNMAGGGMSLRVHCALIILAKAIDMDNQRHPQRKDRE